MSQIHESLPSTGGKAHNVALVLGGGGAAGNAWEIGIIAGLAGVCANFVGSKISLRAWPG